jgi:hypothetical protein
VISKKPEKTEHKVEETADRTSRRENKSDRPMRLKVYKSVEFRAYIRKFLGELIKIGIAEPKTCLEVLYQTWIRKNGERGEVRLKVESTET